MIRRKEDAANPIRSRLSRAPVVDDSLDLTSSSRMSFLSKPKTKTSLPFLFILQNGRICLFGRSLASGRVVNLSVPSLVDHLEFPANVLCHTFFEPRFDSFYAAVKI